ncbi:capsid cement protein [Pseudarthrobacter sp. P1]|uniref:capsid cement protein n=1 Tax=Pseudarthrobacter sp. P1 TaxID=3418418 RepID=UPI003CEA1543
MPKNTAIPYFAAGPFTGTPTVDVTGKRFVKYATGGKGGAPKIAKATAKLAIAGVAAHDQTAGVPVTVETDGVVPVTAGEAIAAGDQIAAGTDGVAMKVTTGDVVVGVAVADAAINTDAPIRLSV